MVTYSRRGKSKLNLIHFSIRVVCLYYCDINLGVLTHTLLCRIAPPQCARTSSHSLSLSLFDNSFLVRHFFFSNSCHYQCFYFNDIILKVAFARQMTWHTPVSAEAAKQPQSDIRRLYKLTGWSITIPKYLSYYLQKSITLFCEKIVESSNRKHPQRGSQSPLWLKWRATLRWHQLRVHNLLPSRITTNDS
jgi:hypothetical protein